MTAIEAIDAPLAEELTLRESRIKIALLWLASPRSRCSPATLGLSLDQPGKPCPVGAPRSLPQSSEADL